MRVFSLRKYKKWCKRSGSPEYSWADDCDGLTEKEMTKLGYSTSCSWTEARARWNKTKKNKITAKEMFESVGMIKSGINKSLSGNPIIMFEEETYIGHDRHKRWKYERIIFDLRERTVECSQNINGDVYHEYPLDLTPYLIIAITQQMKELGWIE